MLHEQESYSWLEFIFKENKQNWYRFAFAVAFRSISDAVCSINAY